MTDDEFLEHRRKDLEASVEYFSSLHKPQREMWVVSQFVGNLGISAAGSDLKPALNDPPDVLFKNANFEIKEIMDRGRRRHAEYKEALAKARVARKAQELIEHYTPRDITLSEVSSLIGTEAERWAKHYDSNTCQRLDLLFYVNLQDVMGMAEVPYPDVTTLSNLPWRSVAFVMGWRACVLVARDDAPDFLKSAIGKVWHRQVC